VTEPLEIALVVTTALDACGIPYSIGGSMASSFSGEPRASVDVDILVDMDAEHVVPFVHLLGDSFYANPDALLRAISARSAANVVHRPSGIKVDLFVAGSHLDRQQLDRRLRVRVSFNPDRFVFVHSPEDILLQKLHWYRLGGQVSDRQWRDVLSIIVVQQTRLDRHYLGESAAKEGLTDLLERAMREAAS
jgi:hypothetical protein